MGGEGTTGIGAALIGAEVGGSIGLRSPPARGIGGDENGTGVAKVPPAVSAPEPSGGGALGLIRSRNGSDSAKGSADAGSVAGTTGVGAAGATGV